MCCSSIWSDGANLSENPGNAGDSHVLILENKKSIMLLSILLKTLVKSNLFHFKLPCNFHSCNLLIGLLMVNQPHSSRKWFIDNIATGSRIRIFTVHCISPVFCIKLFYKTRGTLNFQFQPPA